MIASGTGPYRLNDVWTKRMSVSRNSPPRYATVEGSSAPRGNRTSKRVGRRPSPGRAETTLPTRSAHKVMPNELRCFNRRATRNRFGPVCLRARWQSGRCRARRCPARSRWQNQLKLVRHSPLCRLGPKENLDGPGHVARPRERSSTSAAHPRAKQARASQRTNGAQERTRTSTALRPPAPEAGASTIPPPGHGACRTSFG